MESVDEFESAIASKEHRKQLRRDRISGRRNDDISKKAAPSCRDNEKYSSDEQVARSFESLDSIQAKSTELITEARARTIRREAMRRDDEEKDNRKRDELLAQVEDPLYSDQVGTGWRECQAATNVQDLCKILDNQKTMCEAAITKLERICEGLGSELREKDLEYVTALKRNRQEVELLQKCMTDEHLMLKAAFERELKLIEDSLSADRDYILNTNRDELEALVLKRETAENDSLVQQRRIIDCHRSGINESESKMEQDREDLKKKLESEVRRLEVELEDTRARHQFDTDKLEYNVRVLTELSENEEAVKKQKRRIMKGKEELTRELEDKHHAKARGIRRNEILEGDCERIEKQSSGLREKFERFKISDDEKFRAVLGMHRDDLQRLKGELNQSQGFIFGGDQSCTSDLTWPGDVKSNKTDECMDEFGLESDANSNFNQSVDKSDEWKQAETLMSSYRSVLERRQGLTSEVASMDRCNERLERELKSKLREKVNEELAFPPSSMISVDNDAR